MSLLCCPVCGRELTKAERAYTCPARHTFDIAREGYVNLMAGKPPAVGDNREMIAARHRTLESGIYARFCEALREVAAEAPQGTFLDVGCGEGYYTERMALSRTGDVIGIDISKDALKLSCRRLPRATLAVASAYHLPLADCSVALLSAIFAPMATEEFHRVLNVGGRLVLAVPGPRHLFGMKEILYDTPYENEVQDTALAGFTLLEKRAVTFDLTLPSQEAIADLFAMTPYCYRTPRAGRERLAALDTLSISAEFYVLVYEKAKP